MRSNNYLIDNFNNASNWQVIEGSWSIAPNGVYTAGYNNAITGAINFTAKNLVFECEIDITAYGDAGVHILSYDSSNGLYLSFRPAENKLVLYDSEPFNIIASVNLTITSGWKRLRVIMLKDRFTAYYDNMQVPILDCITGIHLFHSFGKVFLRSYYNQASYRKLKIYELNTFNTDTFDQLLPTKWIPYKGDFTIDNGRLINTGGNMSTFIANSDYYDNFILEADLSIDGSGNCGFFIRNTDPINDVGYFISFSSASNQCTVYSQNGIVENASVTINTNVFHHIRIICSVYILIIYFNNMDMVSPLLIANIGYNNPTGRFGVHTYYTPCKFDNVYIRSI